MGGGIRARSPRTRALPNPPKRHGRGAYTAAMRIAHSRWLLVHNGAIHTQDPRAPRVEALLARDGTVVATGTKDDVEALARHLGSHSGDQARLDLEGATVVPGLIDAHIHLLHWAASLDRVALAGVTSRAEVLRRIADSVAKAPAGSWVQGWGWDHSLWEDTDGGFPDAGILDAVAPDVPVALSRKDGHMMWLNSKAMSLAGIGPSTEVPPGGVLGRDLHGAPNGLLFENAMELLDKAIPSLTHQQAVDLFRRHLPALHKVGLTGVHVPEGSRSFRALQALDASGELGVRVHMMLPSGVARDLIAAGVTSGLGSPRVKVGHVKFFIDGSLGSETAAMFEPFIGSPANVGVLTMDPADLLDAVRDCIAANLAPAIHAIGDRANRTVLDVLEATRDAWLPNGIRPRIEHVQVLHPADVERFGSLGVVASAQPIHATQDMELVDRLWGSRGRYAYAFGSLEATGATLAFGSDAPVETPDPLQGIYAAVTRRRPDGNPDGGWYPEERLTAARAIAAYTTGAAWASGDEGVVGELSPGSRADLVVLSGDPFTASPEALARLRVCATVFEGEVVYRE